MQKAEWDLHTERFANEIKLLLLCSHKQITAAQEQEIRSIVDEGVDWQLLLKAGKKHRVFPMVYYNIKRMDSLPVDENFLRRIQALCQRNLMNSVRMTAELAKINKLMTAHGIRTISLKGPLLGMAIYDDVALRNTGDLDILSDIKDLDKIEQLLIAAGFVSVEAQAISTPKRKARYIQIKHHLLFKSPEGIEVEIHWRYSNQSSPDQFDKLWDQRREVEVSGQKIAVLSPEDEFIYLAAHGGKHGWTRLRWLCDLAEIIKNGQPDWDEVIRKAKKLEVMELLVQAVILVNQLLDTEIPAAIKPIAARHKLGLKLAHMAIPLFLEYDSRPTEIGHPQYRYYKKYTYARSKGLKRKLTFLLFQLNPQQADYETVNFKDRYFFMYYLLRPYYKIRRALM